MLEGRKPEYPEKTPGDELQNMLHTKARKFKPQAQQHWRQARKADVLSVTPRVAQGWGFEKENHVMWARGEPPSHSIVCTTCHSLVTSGSPPSPPRQTDRLTDRHTDRQTDRQID